MDMQIPKGVVGYAAAALEFLRGLRIPCGTNDAKAQANLKKHEVSFEAARLVFDDRGGIDEIEDRGEYGEDRFIAIGMVGGRLLTVAYTERDGRIRIISARKATRREQDSYIIHNR